MPNSKLRIQRTQGGVRVNIRLQPKASKPGIVGIHGDALKVRVSAPPVDGAANDALVELLAATFKIPRSAVTIVAGLSSRSKVVELAGVAESDVLRIANGGNG
jgi:uncharacterized protein (TIGR00251 family)